MRLRTDPEMGLAPEPVLGQRKSFGCVFFFLMQIDQEIGSEAKFQRDFLDELQMTLIRAQAGVKNNIRKLNLSIIQSGNNHIMHVVLFALFCFCILYLWSKMFKR
ncbi:hypothetical protein HA466_0293500 [Hirschfeldia incana]|nr:hypothetical protein HA466_0293500 [Hirschfeldia incana]